MDIQRPDFKKARNQRRAIYVTVGVLGLILTTAGLSRLKPAAPLVQRAQVWTDTVKRGPMVREVRGTGTLVPEEIVWIPTRNAGRIERILVLPGAAVEADTVLVELSNPEVAKLAFEAQWQLKAAEAELANLRVQLESQRLSQEAAVAAAQASCKSAQLDYEVNQELALGGLVPQVVLKQSKAKAEETAAVLQIERKRLDIGSEAAKAQQAVQQAKVEQIRAELDLRGEQVRSLKIRAGINGVLQKLGDTLPLQVGQQLAAGSSVARVANPIQLKAEIRIHETQAKDILLNQPACIDTRNGIVQGRVRRIDPAVQNGTVTVDVVLEGSIPKGARPDLSVEGTIQLERLGDVLYVGRPVHGDPDSTVGIFKLARNGKEAVRVPVRLGRSSVTTIEVLNGLEAGDQIILSDMSRWDSHGSVRLN